MAFSSGGNLAFDDSWKNEKFEVFSFYIKYKRKKHSYSSI